MAAGPPLRIGPCVHYSKADAFEICSALALAESLLRSLGREADAALVGEVFEVAEAGLARGCGVTPATLAPEGGGSLVLARLSARSAQSSLGSNSMARELTQ